MLLKMPQRRKKSNDKSASAFVCAIPAPAELCTIVRCLNVLYGFKKHGRISIDFMDGRDYCAGLIIARAASSVDIINKNNCQLAVNFAIGSGMSVLR
jgi:hypothetical protein